MPKLSVIIPTYNSGVFLKRCLYALSRSTYKDFEAIIVDESSNDNTIAIAQKYRAKVLRQVSKGRSNARNEGISTAIGEIIVFVDSDNYVKNNALWKINTFFEKHEDIDAVVGMVTKKHPNRNFLSQYKNLYMYSKFINLPIKISFLQGDIYAVKKESVEHVVTDVITDDTLRGVLMIEHKKHIYFDKSIQATHAKQYNLKKIILNDFQIPYHWAQIFWKHQGWSQMGKSGSGFAHASREQILSLLLAPILALFLFALFFHPDILPFGMFGFAFWIWLNHSLLIFLYKEKGLNFALKSTIFTFFDHLVMFVGIVFGSTSYFVKLLKN